MEEMEKNQLEQAQDVLPEETEAPVDTEETEVQPEEETPDEPAKKEKGSFLSELLEIAETMIVSVFAVLLLFTYLCRPVTVDGNSMNPTLLNDDRLVMYRMFYEPKRGDIVVVNNHNGNLLNKEGQVISSGYSLNENLIKRVVAVEGEELNIDFEAGVVMIDGVPLEEDYINDLTHNNDGAFTYPITIPKGYIFVMGDNRNHSTDSRSSAVGLIAVEDIIGKTYFRYYPLSDIGFVG
ncbi:MAG: signal peptidase I [Oscillospiraceae bacterium]|nr:signal peptidase I [Oscillospiraceae bacterium]